MAEKTPLPEPLASLPSEQPLLEVQELKVYFPGRRNRLFGPRSTIRAVDNVSFTVNAGETFGLVGESGCGKTTTARAIVNLIRPTSGRIFLDGERIDHWSESEMRPFRRDVQMIFQDPFASLNPRMTVGRIIGEPLAIHDIVPRSEYKLEVMRLLDLVGLNPRYLNRYPHEFSGGQRQRIGIARALAVRPKIIICDEPVSALDVSIQAQVINLLMELQEKLGIAYVFIAHDLSVVRHISHRVGVMYLGRIVEVADSDKLYSDPRHPYTQALLSAVPIPDPELEQHRKRIMLRGEVPSPEEYYPGCPFADRCPIAELSCLQIPPGLEGSRHQVACFLAEKDEPLSPV